MRLLLDEQRGRRSVITSVLVAATLCCVLLVAAWIRLRCMGAHSRHPLGPEERRRPTIGAAASPKALQRIIEIFPDCATISVVDGMQHEIGIIVVADVRDLLPEIANERAVVVADLMVSTHGAVRPEVISRRGSTR